MKNFLLITFIWINAMAITGNNWVKIFGDTNGDVVVEGVVTDSENNVLITGIYSSEKLELDESTVLQNNGTFDVFIIKYDPLGDIIWAMSFGGQQPDKVSGICADSANNIYITGNFKSQTLILGDTTIQSSWPDNVYIAKIDRNGDLLWLRHSTGVTNMAWGTAVYCVGDKNVLFTGYTNSQKITFGNHNLYLNTANYGSFYGRLDEKGNFQDAWILGDEGEDRYQMNDITADSEGNYYLAGEKTTPTKPLPPDFRDYREIMYFCKTDPAGKILWEVEDTAFCWTERIIINHDSLIVLGNKEEYRMIFNGGTIDTTSSFGYGIFDLDGTRLWDKKVTGALAYDAYAKDSRILVIGGLLLDELELDDFKIQRNSDSSSICPIYQDIFYLESDKSGDINKVESISGSLEDIPTGIWLSNKGDLIYSGKFESGLLSVEQTDVINYSQLTVFQHVSGIYYDRRPFSFLAKHAGPSDTSGIPGRGADNISVYPNPSGGMLSMDIGSLSGTARIRVHDLNGKVWHETYSDEKTTVLDLSDCPGGFYVLTLMIGDNLYKKPVLIIK